MHGIHGCSPAGHMLIGAHMDPDGSTNMWKACYLVPGPPKRERERKEEGN